MREQSVKAFTENYVMTQLAALRGLADQGWMENVPLCAVRRGIVSAACGRGSR